jgi:hypothetical protein
VSGKSNRTYLFGIHNIHDNSSLQHARQASLDLKGRFLAIRSSFGSVAIGAVCDAIGYWEFSRHDYIKSAEEYTISVMVGVAG